VAGIALMLGCLAIYGRLVVVASARSREQFDPRSTLRLWGWPFRRAAASDLSAEPKESSPTE
jgi:hypothetical protein